MNADIGVRGLKDVLLDRKGEIVIVPNGPSLLGSGSVIWGTNSVFDESVPPGMDEGGQSILWGTRTLVGESILWGANKASATIILWGTSVLWGTSSTGEDSTGQGDLF